jgi:hypothetical protein
VRGNPHAAFDAAGAGNVAWSRWCDTRRRKRETTGNTNFDLHRRASPRPYLGAPRGEIPPGRLAICVDFGMSAPRPVRAKSRKCGCPVLPVEGIGLDVIQAPDRGLESRGVNAASRCPVMFDLCAPRKGSCSHLNRTYFTRPAIPRRSTSTTESDQPHCPIHPSCSSSRASWRTSVGSRLL